MRILQEVWGFRKLEGIWGLRVWGNWKLNVMGVLRNLKAEEHLKFQELDMAEFEGRGS